MNAINYDGGCWPTQQQELLLRAALLQGKDAIDAWHDWKSSVNVDHLDQGSYRLLPQLYRNLHIQGVKDPHMEKFKGLYRYTWSKNQIVFHDTATLLGSFRNSGIEALILKGAALVSLYYKDYGMRSIDDFCVLVHTKNVSAAINLLNKLGWTPIQSEPPEMLIPFRYSIRFQSVAERRFDLYWRVLPECCQANADDNFWDGAVSTKIGNVSTSALNPTDQLLHVCVHASQWNILPSFRWLADAMMIMNASESEIDWSRLITQAEKHRFILPVKDTLKYLRDVLDAPVPPDILQSLQELPTSKMERIEYKAKARQNKLLGRLLELWFQYLRSANRTNLQHKIIGFLKYLQYNWGVKHLWQVPLYMLSKSMERTVFAFVKGLYGK